MCPAAVLVLAINLAEDTAVRLLLSAFLFPGFGLVKLELKTKSSSGVVSTEASNSTSFAVAGHIPGLAGGNHLLGGFASLLHFCF